MGLTCAGPENYVHALNSHCSLYNCLVTSTGAIALGKGLQENSSLEELKYVTNTLIITLIGSVTQELVSQQAAAVWWHNC